MNKKLKSLLLATLVVWMASCNNNTSEKKAEMPISDSTSAAELKVPDSVIDSLHLCAALGPMDTVNGKPVKQAGALAFLKWSEQKRVLNVSFLDGDPVIQQKVQQVAKEWEAYCGMVFNFGNFPNPDITITFRQNGSWSYIGKSSLSHVPSMNYGWFTRNTSDEEFHRTVLHEFGHALGLIHEHQNPNNNPIHWNKPVVYSYFMRPPNNWSKEMIDYNLFETYDQDQINGTNFDPSSIMLYGFPKELTLDGYSTSSNSRLSDLDKKLIGIVYPK